MSQRVIILNHSLYFKVINKRLAPYCTQILISEPNSEATWLLGRFFDPQFNQSSGQRLPTLKSLLLHQLHQIQLQRKSN